MRSHPGAFDLSFIVPRRCHWLQDGDGILLMDGQYTLPRGSRGEIDGGLLRLRGDSREAVFDDAAALVARMPKTGPMAIAAILHTPARPSGFDRWHIIIGASVAFSPTSLDPYFPQVT